MLPAFTPQRFGNYQLTAHLGRGGMADVFRAVHAGAAGFERVVVVKKILGPYNDDPSFVSMFINEAKIAAQLTHPNIVQVYELGEVDGEYFMAMEYVKGLDLVHALRWLSRAGGARSFPPEAAAAFESQVSAVQLLLSSQTAQKVIWPVPKLPAVSPLLHVVCGP